jgi:hypothetical protein
MVRLDEFLSGKIAERKIDDKKVYLAAFFLPHPNPSEYYSSITIQGWNEYWTRHFNAIKKEDNVRFVIWSGRKFVDIGSNPSKEGFLKEMDSVCYSGRSFTREQLKKIIDEVNEEYSIRDNVIVALIGHITGSNLEQDLYGSILNKQIDFSQYYGLIVSQAFLRTDTTVLPSCFNEGDQEYNRPIECVGGSKTRYIYADASNAEHIGDIESIMKDHLEAIRHHD